MALPTATEIVVLYLMCDVTAIEVGTGKIQGYQDVSCILPGYQLAIFKRCGVINNHKMFTLYIKIFLKLFTN